MSILIEVLLLGKSPQIMLETQAVDDTKPRVHICVQLKRVGTGFVAKGNSSYLFVFRSIRLSFLCLLAVLGFVLFRDKRSLFLAHQLLLPNSVGVHSMFAAIWIGCVVVGLSLGGPTGLTNIVGNSTSTNSIFTGRYCPTKAVFS